MPPASSRRLPAPSSILPDLMAFALGIGVAAYSGWDVTTLVWGLWLSSLVVGYATIVTSAARSATAFMKLAKGGGPGSRFAGLAGILGSLFILAFFTVHFGGFHLGHSVFLFLFFPIGGVDFMQGGGLPGVADYVSVVKQAGFFLPAAILAERRNIFPPRRVDMSLEEEAGAIGDGMVAPYKNVVRLHLLIFFFAFAHFTQLDSLVVYVVVYAMYFFPLRAFFPKKTPAATEVAPAEERREAA